MEFQDWGENSDERSLNSVEFTEKKHYNKCSFKILLLFVLLCFLLITSTIMVISNFYVLKLNYDRLNTVEINNFILREVDKNDHNFTNILQIRTKILEETMLRSRMNNLESGVKLTYLDNFTTNKVYDSKFTISNSTNPSNLNIYKALCWIFSNILNKNNNLPFPFEEVNIMNLNDSSYINYNPKNTSNISFFLSNNPNRKNDIIKTQTDSGFVDQVFEDDYRIDDRYKYSKYRLVKVTKGNIMTAFLICFKTQLFNYIQTYKSKVKSNITVIIKYDSNKIVFLPTSNYLQDFFYYGLSDQSNLNTINKIAQTSTKLITTHSSTFSLDVFFDFLNQNLFNKQLSEEFKIFSALFYNTILLYFKDINSDFFQKFINISSPSNILNATLFPKSISLKKIDISDNNYNDRFLNPYYTISHIFRYSDQSKNILSNFEKKIICYNDKLNQIETIVLEMINLENYSLLQLDFQNRMNSSTYFILLIVLCLFFMIIPATQYIAILGINRLIERLKQISVLKKILLYNNQDFKYFDLPQEKIMNLSNKMKEVEKISLINNDCFFEVLVLIILETKTKLIKFLNNIEMDSEVQYLNKLYVFKRKFRLMSYTFNNKMDDYREASKYYKVLHNMSIFNMDEVHYNLFYTKYFSNVSLKPFYSLLEMVDNENAIEDFSNKFFSFEEVLKLFINFKTNILKPILKSLYVDQSEVNQSSQKDKNYNLTLN